MANSAPEPILAQPMNGLRCRFVLPRPVDPERWVYFPDVRAAAGSPLAERLFAVPGIQAVLIAHDKVTLTRAETGALPLVGPALNRLRRAMGDARAGADEWPRLGRQIGQVLRAHLQSGEPAVSEASHEGMPTSAELRARVEAVLDAEVNPVVAGHGGGVEVVNLIDNVVYLRMQGGCQGCGLADVTLSVGVAAVLHEQIPELGEIYDVTNHRAGSKPFVRPGAAGRAASPFRNRPRADD